MALPTINIPNFAGASTAVPVANSGRQAAADSSAVVLSNEDLAALAALPTGASTAANQATLNTVAGAVGDAAWASGNGTLVALLKAIAANAVSTAPSPVISSLPYQAVAVSQTAKVLGATGAIGDSLAGIIIQPTGTTVGSVIVYDNTTAVYTYPGGTVGADLRPIVVGMGMVCVGAGWHVTTPANATVLALGKFT